MQPAKTRSTGTRRTQTSGFARLARRADAGRTLLRDLGMDERAPRDPARNSRSHGPLAVCSRRTMRHGGHMKAVITIAHGALVIVCHSSTRSHVLYRGLQSAPTVRTGG